MTNLTPRGGTAILIKKPIHHHAIHIHIMEQTCITIKGSPPNLTICLFYKPPRTSSPGLVNDLLKILRNRHRCFITGDLNLKHRSWNPTSNSIGGYSFMRNCGYCIMSPIKPTRIPDRKKRK
ncbi:hypothetical protein TNCT_225551 [Trichonephila clavata]|uniref:Endonuclease/exonuclease/phosphatase domain-containing protein n=1 Tax=Trichonephila clavata TaxID=2740835 RepID=A0A8X6IB72_TRICU|nr:hypothetical protein TNCT_225551 [Trichonephila clavata]